MNHDLFMTQRSDDDRVLYPGDGEGGGRGGKEKNLSFLFFAPFHSFEHAQQSSRSLGDRITRPAAEVSAAVEEGRVEEVEEEAKAATLDCPYRLSVFSRPDSRKRHLESCSSRPSFRESSTSKKRDQPGEGAKDGHNERSAIGSLADATDSGPKNYYNLDENEALRFPRQSATNGVIYRREVYCRMPGCRDTTRFKQITYLRRHYRRKHYHEWAADKKSITVVGKLKHGKGLQGCSGNLVKLSKWN